VSRLAPDRINASKVSMDPSMAVARARSETVRSSNRGRVTPSRVVFH
jgi:hypothetical protein